MVRIGEMGGGERFVRAEVVRDGRDGVEERGWREVGRPKCNGGMEGGC